jgi:hypothetical protein
MNESVLSLENPFDNMTFEVAIGNYAISIPFGNLSHGLSWALKNGLIGFVD